VILEYMVKRPPRERWALAATIVVLGFVACYTAAIGPSLETLDGTRTDLRTTETGLVLQQRQLDLLRAKTKAAHRTLADLRNVPCPWVPADKADGILQELQAEAAGLGLSVSSTIRERVAKMTLKDSPARVSVLMVRLELSGQYASVMELLRRLDKRSIAIGLQDLIVKGNLEPPYNVQVTLLVRLPIVEGEKRA
jgi:hypothetical protein